MIKKIWGTEEYLKAARKLIGKEVDEVRVPEPIHLDVGRIRDFSYGLGDDNPLFTDPAYATTTRYGCLIAPPTILSMIRYPMSHGAYWERRDVEWMFYSFFSGNRYEWFDVIRVGDRLRSSLILKDVFTKQGRSGDLVFHLTEGTFRNQREDVPGKEYGTLILVAIPDGMERGEHAVYERGTHRYSEEEIQRITKDIEAETRRGSKTLYWDEVKVGDKLTPVVKVMHLGDMILWRCGAWPPTVWMPGPFELLYKLVKEQGGARRNPITNWPYDHAEWEHEDYQLCKLRGLPGPFDMGVMRTQLPSHLLCNWMGDDGFLRKLEVQIRKPFYYGDTLWYRGAVVNKYTTKEDDVEYDAVDIKIEGVNQIGEMVAPGSATIYLPSPGKEVQLPIPH